MPEERTERRATQVETEKRVREQLSIPLTVGGGVRSLDHVERLTTAGADRVSVNTAAFDRPSMMASVNRLMIKSIDRILSSLPGIGKSI